MPIYYVQWIPSKRRVRLPRTSICRKEYISIWLIKQMTKKVLDKQTNRSVSTVISNFPNEGNQCSIKTLISLPYKEKLGENVIHSLRNT